MSVVQVAVAMALVVVMVMTGEATIEAITGETIEAIAAETTEGTMATEVCTFPSAGTGPDNLRSQFSYSVRCKCSRFPQ